jgi:NAD-dependent dihydropyrimidine dehydrogenase PreA subunit
VVYVIAEPCIDLMDKSCIEECPVDAIYQGLSMSYIHPAECIDCGACEPVCPVDAIYYEDDVPPNWARFIVAAEDFAQMVGPGDSRAPFDFDSPIIANRTPAPRVTSQVRPSEIHPFLGGSVGSHVAVIWATFSVDSDMLKALLLPFDKIAVVGRAHSRLTSSRDWVALQDMGLVANLSPFDILTAVPDESIWALYHGLMTVQWNSISASSHVNAEADMLIRDVLLPLFLSVDRRDIVRGIRRRFTPGSKQALPGIVSQLAMQTLALMGVRISPVSIGLDHAISFAEIIPKISLGQRATTLDTEGITPSLAGTALHDVLRFREEARHAFEQHTNIMMAYMNRVIPGTEPTAEDLDPIVMSAATLRRMGRTWGLTGRGYVGFGLAGSPTCCSLSSAAGVEAALASDGFALPRCTSPAYIYATTYPDPLIR